MESKRRTESRVTELRGTAGFRLSPGADVKAPYAWSPPYFSTALISQKSKWDCIYPA